MVGIDRFGESAPGPNIFKHFGFTVESVVAAVKRILSVAVLVQEQPMTIRVTVNGTAASAA